jgi:hypothetical protein
MYDANQQLVNQLFQFIKQAGYSYSKDDLGFYFDSGLKRFSIMKTGPFLKTYYNVKEKGKYKLKDKLASTMNLFECLQWILKKIQQS